MSKVSSPHTNTIPFKNFWKAIDVLLKKPHVVNKRLWGSKILYRKTHLNCSSLLPFGRLKNINNIEDYIINVQSQINNNQDSISLSSSNKELEVLLIELLPKSFNENHAFQLVLLRKDCLKVSFHDITPDNFKQNLCPDFNFTFELKEDEVILSETTKANSKSWKWLQETVLPQVIKWNKDLKDEIQKPQICNESLALVSNDEYYEKYNALKIKYGKDMVQIWPECTDPTKFVYEDVAIATYILLLWEDERKHIGTNNLQSFVDLGCGNGLLVYILMQEGHNGIGIDVRKRQIWDMYSREVKLEEKTIIPSDSHLFPSTDWVIGNHSDELTPWIPVISARSSYKCNFFLLPCCAYNFDGTKYQRHNSAISQYTEYLQYIKQLCENCGFRTDTDRLKIPSTKRICLIGRERTYPEEEYSTYCNKIQIIINQCSTKHENSQDSWIKDFKAREPLERVRNCTQIDKGLVETIVQIISSHLLKGCSSQISWSAGNTAEISEVVKLIPSDKLKALKSECGGLQTLLKNNHHIFKVQSGKVQLTRPKSITEVNSNAKSSKKAKLIKLQQKPCWFYNHHPQGCPLIDTDCSFLHNIKK